jgi:hypothetical protein
MCTGENQKARRGTNPIPAHWGFLTGMGSPHLRGFAVALAIFSTRSRTFALPSTMIATALIAPLRAERVLPP